MKVLFLGKSDSKIREYLAANCRTSTADTPLVLSELKEMKFDYIVSHGYRHIIKPEILELFPHRAINCHISYLPWNRGADPNLWSCVEKTPKGFTIHEIDNGLDTGDILAQREIKMYGQHWTLRSSYDLLTHEMTKAFQKLWPKLVRGEVVPRKQEAGGSFHSLKDRERLEHILTLGWDTPISELTLEKA